MVPIEQETNFEVVRNYAIWLKSEVEKLSKENAELKNAQADARQVWLSNQLRSQLVRLQKKFYGFGREQLTPKSRPVGHEQQKLKLHGNRWHEENEPTSITPVKHEVGEKIEYDFASEALEKESDLRGVPMGSKAWAKMNGLYQEHTEITVIERVYKKVVHRQARYRLKDEYNTTGKEVIITAPGPVKLKPGSQYSVDFALSVVSDKYEYHLPLERIRRRMESAGFKIDVKTLFTLCKQVAEHVEKEVVEAIRQDILGDFCAAHLDESTWLIKGSKSQGYMWTLSNRVGSVYRFEPTRSGKVALEMLADYRGAVVTDAYGGYNRLKNLKDMRVGHCWSHARREFFDRLDDYPNEVPEIVGMIDELFDIEAKPETFEDLRVLRKTESVTLIKKIYDWLLSHRTKFLKAESIVGAIDYTLKNWKELTLFLTDLSVPLSNNDAERAMRHVVMGRKNFSGSKSIDGADIAATLYTVIESAKKVGLDPREYFKYVITERWYDRKPLSPAQKFGKNKQTVFPEEDQWRI